MKPALWPLAAIVCLYLAIDFWNAPERRAVRDVRAGRAHLLDAGTVALYTPGVDWQDPLVAALPHRELPNGCTNPSAMAYVRYAEAYNAATVRELLRR